MSDQSDTSAPSEGGGLSIPLFGRARVRLMHAFRLCAWAERKQGNRDLRAGTARERWRADFASGFENSVRRPPPAPHNRISVRGFGGVQNF